MFGIRITSDDGENLSFRQALSRAGEVFRDGMGFAIPILELYRMFRSYQQHRDTVDLDWDVDCEVTYTKWNLFKKLAIPVAVAASVGLITVASFDAVLPRYRTIDMSISNFSDNYNVYNKLFYDGNAQSLNSDGKTDNYLNPADHSYYRLENGENVPIARFEGFTYDLEGEKVSGISLKQEGYDVYFSLPLSGKSDSDDTASAWLPVEGKIAMITAVASRPSMTVKKLESFIESMDEKLKEDASSGITWIVEDVRFFWQVDADLFYEYQNSNHSPIYEYSLLLNIEFLS